MRFCHFYHRCSLLIGSYPKATHDEGIAPFLPYFALDGQERAIKDHTGAWMISFAEAVSEIHVEKVPFQMPAYRQPPQAYTPTL